MLKVALISTHASPLAAAGSGDGDSLALYVAQLGAELGALGCQIDIFTRRDRIEQPQVHYWRPNVRVIHVPAGPPGMVGHNHDDQDRLHTCMEQFGRFVVGFARRQRGGYDIAHACDLPSGCAAQQLRRTLGVPYAVTVAAPPPPPPPPRTPSPPPSLPAAGGLPLAGALPLAQLLGDADRVLAPCRQQRDALQAVAGARRSRIDIVPCGFDPAQLWPVRLRARGLLRLPAHGFLALHVAPLAPGHGIATAIEGMAQLARRHAVAAALLVVGAVAAGGASELARLRALACRLDVAVTFAGPQPAAALRHWYSAADAFIAAPCHGAFGMAVLGAMACATPVVGAAVGCIAGTVVEGETGYLVAPYHAAALADRLAHLHAQPVQARSLGVQGWRRAHRHYTWRGVARRLSAVYAQVLAGVAADVAADVVDGAGDKVVLGAPLA